MSSVMDMYRDKATREAFVTRAKEAYEKIKAELEGKEGLVAMKPAPTTPALKMYISTSYHVLRGKAASWSSMRMK